MKHTQSIDKLAVAALGAILLLKGGFEFYSIMLSGVLTLGLLAVQISRGCYKKIQISWQATAFFTGLVVFPALTLFWGVDRGMCFLGVLRMLPMVLWGVFALSLERQQKEDVLKMVPLMGTALVLVGCACYAIPGTKNWFWQAGRLGGTFQYANTFGLFLLLGFVVLFTQLTMLFDKENKKSSVSLKQKGCALVQGLALPAGILLTGSRSTAILFELYLMYIAIAKKQKRKWAIGFLGCTIATGITSFFIMGMQQNLGRIFTLATHNSTLYGRLLYWQDGLRMLMDCHWMGVGATGYERLTGFYQTGVYTTLFLHNDWLQIAIDFGVISLLLLGIYWGWQIVKGKQGGLEKEILFLTGVACLTDFHMQYLVIIMICLLCMDFGGQGWVRGRKKLWEDYLSLSVLAVICIYFGMAGWHYQRGNYRKAISYYPAYTAAKEARMRKTDDSKEAFDLAKDVLKTDKNSADASNVMAYVALTKGNISGYISYKQKVINQNPYVLSQYQEYVSQLGSLVSQEEQNANKNAILMEALDRLETTIEQNKKRESFLAKKIKDTIDFSQVEKNISSLQEMIDN